MTKKNPRTNLARKATMKDIVSVEESYLKALVSFRNYFEEEIKKADIRNGLFIAYLAHKQLINLQEFVEFSKVSHEAVEKLNKDIKEKEAMPSSPNPTPVPGDDCMEKSL